MRQTGIGIDFLRPLCPANLHHRFGNTAPKGRCISERLEKIGGKDNHGRKN